MPCTDGGVPFPPTREEVLADKVPAMLCAIVGAINFRQGSSHHGPRLASRRLE